MIESVRNWAGSIPVSTWWLIAGAAIGVALLAWLLVRVAVKVNQAVSARRDKLTRDADNPSGAGLFYLVALMSMAVSVDTSWRFFGDVLKITNPVERGLMFAVLEAALIACGFAMRANVRATKGDPGGARVFAWLLTMLSAFMALQVSTFLPGLARVALGPVLGIVALHLALGIEIRHANPEGATTWGRIFAELRERGLSRLGLANDGRDAAMLARDRAALRVAWLVTDDSKRFRKTRLNRALRVSNVAHDPAARDRMLSELAVIQHVSALATLDRPSPWGQDTLPGQSDQGEPDNLTGHGQDVADVDHGTDKVSGVDRPDVAPEESRSGRTGPLAVLDDPAARTLLDLATSDAERVRVAMNAVGVEIKDVTAYLAGYGQNVKPETVRTAVRRALKSGTVVPITHDRKRA